MSAEDTVFADVTWVIEACALRDKSGDLAPLVRIKGIPDDAYFRPDQARRAAAQLLIHAEEAEGYVAAAKAQPNTDKIAAMPAQGRA